jgi:hypothetical protein
MPRLLDNIPQVAPDELVVAVGLDRVPGWRVYRKFGMNDDVPATGTEEMWPIGTAKVWPAAAGVVSLVSSSADDDASPATGAWSVIVEGLDANYDEVSETIALDGVTPSVGAVSFLRVNRAYVAAAGSGAVNAGNITGSIGGNAQLYIEALEGQTHQTHYTVPANHTLVVNNFVVGVGRMAGSSDIHVRSMIRLNGGANDEAWRAISDIYLWDGSIHRNDGSATVVPAKTDIKQEIVSTSTTQAFSIFSGYLIDTTKF